MTVCYWCGAKDTLADVGKELDDGKYKMVQCSKCKNAYYVVNKEKMNKPKPMTNEEWLRKCTTEQLAEYLADKFNEVVDFVLHEVDENAEDIEPDDYWYRQDVIVEWLKQPHKE